jgi:hypothetical protein
MKRACLICLFPCLTTVILMSQSNPIPLINPSASVVSPHSASPADPEAQARILDSYGKLPLSFEANHGQTDGRVKFLSRTSGYSLFLTGDEAVLRLSGKKASANKAKVAGNAQPKSSATAATVTDGVLRMRLHHANADANVTGTEELESTSNYFIGNDPSKWRTSVPTYAKVKYEGIYSGIDLVYYGNQRQLEYDFIVAPGADPRRIAFDVSGAKRIRKDAHGDLVLKVGEGEIRWHKPVVYQEKDGARQEIAARYVIADATRVGFELAKYDASRRLYIDPLIYSTYLGGSGQDWGHAIAVDSAGNAYVTGFTSSTDFPITPGAFQSACEGCSVDNGDAFVSKLNPSGSALVYSTYLGGSGSYGLGIAVDSTGNAYVTGYTYSTDFPITTGAFQTIFGGASGDANAFVTKLNPTGSALVYSTYLGGTYAGGNGIAVDSARNAYVTGFAGKGFPTKNPLQAALAGGIGLDAFVSKLNPEGSALVYSTYLGGSGQDVGSGIAVDTAGNAYVAGTTASTDFPTRNPLQPTCGGGNGNSVCGGYAGDAFVSKINSTGSALVYSTYLGGSGNDGANGIAVDGTGNAYVVGTTTSADFPTKNPLQPTFGGGGGSDAFIAEINRSGSALVYSTYLGGIAWDGGSGIAVDGKGYTYVTGTTTDQYDFPQKDPLQKNADDGVFVAKIRPLGAGLVYSTGIGAGRGDQGAGIAVDSAGNAYVTGATLSSNFTTTPGAFQRTYAGGHGGDAFVAKLYPLPVTTTTLSSALNPSTYGQAVQFKAEITSDAGAPPDGEIVSFMKGPAVLGTAVLSSGVARFTTSTLPAGTSGIRAVYGGDSKFDPSTSNTVMQVVNKATTKTALTSSLNPSKVGQSVTFTASVTPEFGGKVTGTVSFYDGATLLKTASVSGGAAKCTTTSLTAGAHTIKATYNGSPDLDGSASAPLTQTVN